VLTTGNVETLLLLTAIAGAALLIFGILDGIRSAITARMGCWLNERLAPVLIAGGVRARLAGDMAGTQPLRDLGQVQSFLSSQGLSALFDAPWTPIFLMLIWLLHPTLGIFAAASALLLVILGMINEMTTRGSIQAASNTQIAAFHQ